MPKAQPQMPVAGEVNDPTAVPAWTGPGEVGWYRSEFGCVSWSSFESMSAQLSPDQWGMQVIFLIFFPPDVSLFPLLAWPCLASP